MKRMGQECSMRCTHPPISARCRVQRPTGKLPPDGQPKSSGGNQNQDFVLQHMRGK